MPDKIVRPSMKFIKAGYVLAFVILAAAVAGYVYLQMWWLPIAAALLFLWPAQRHIRRQFTVMRIEGDKLRYETGFLSKSTRTIQLSKVQDVRMDQSLGQRLFGVGDLSIETAGETSRLTVRNIDRPQNVADEIMEASQSGLGKGHVV